MAVRAAAGAYRSLTMVTLLGIAAQFFLAGLGVFSRRQHGASDGYFGPHMLLGTALGGLTLLLAIAAVLGRAGRPAVRANVALFILAGPVEPVLAMLGGDASAWFGGLHAIVGVAIAALAGSSFFRLRARRRSQGSAS